MSQTEAAVDQLISIVVPLIESSRTLATALDAANARAVASAAELAEFISTDAEEDARQLAQQDADLAAGINDKAAKLAADIAAIQNPPVVEASPGEGEPAETVDGSEVATEGEDEAVRTDEGSATDDATVEVVEDPAASEVITPEANAPESQEEFDAENR